MKLRKTMVVLLLLVFAISMTAFVGCGDKDKEDSFEIVLFDESGHQVTEPGPYTFAYDGEKHVFSAKVKMNGKIDDGLKIDVRYDTLIDGEQVICQEVKEIGVYGIRYAYLWHGPKYVGEVINITVIIE